MSIWFTEKHTPHSGITMEVREGLYHHQSPYQTIDVLDTHEFGRVLLLDGLVMLTERDEFVYHEMLAHVPLISHPDPGRVLVIGGGDGGTVREVLKHSGVERITLVEIDEMVVRAALEYFPEISSGLKDPRVDIIYGDGVDFVRSVSGGRYDAVLVDSTDPVGPAEALFSEEFFTGCHRSLSKGGVFASQTESPFYHSAFMAQVFTRLDKVFPQARFYFAPVTTYPSGNWSFILGRKEPDVKPRLNRAGDLDTRYYNDQIHVSSFALPRFLAEMLRER